MWSPADGKYIAYREVTSVAWSPNGERIASGGVDGTVQVWDARTGQPLHTYTDPEDSPIASVAWSPDGERIASSSGDGTAQVWQAP